ncbi:hypothetical protein PoB_005868800 [Plakobranchus ocellatus]|uniref:RNase H type-1 domain-containing protein n=1 Tax=Plakobranchus ocellatus TaxID=259542 RepID=A0AAV4CJN7_9GAST|nr:hypothetical protein PoB_005868800 [Plakobranchus ocellatus]
MCTKTSVRILHEIRTAPEDAPLAKQTWSPIWFSPLPKLNEIGWTRKKEDALPSVIRALALERIDSFDKEYILCSTDGSTRDGVLDGGYGIFIQWPDETTTRTLGPVGNRCAAACVSTKHSSNV